MQLYKLLKNRNLRLYHFLVALFLRPFFTPFAAVSEETTFSPVGP
jgi:hypothetical protein